MDKENDILVTPATIISAFATLQSTTPQCRSVF